MPASAADGISHLAPHLHALLNTPPRRHMHFAPRSATAPCVTRVGTHSARGDPAFNALADVPCGTKVWKGEMYLPLCLLVWSLISFSARDEVRQRIMAVLAARIR